MLFWVETPSELWKQKRGHGCEHYKANEIQGDTLLHKISLAASGKRRRGRYVKKTVDYYMSLPYEVRLEMQDDFGHPEYRAF